MRSSLRDRIAQSLTADHPVTQLLRFIAVGSTGMVLHLGAYAALVMALSPVAANAVAWLLSTLVCNHAHRRLTFGVRGHRSAGADAVIGMATALLALGVSTVALWLAAPADGLAQVAVILMAGAVGGGLRFVLLRWWLTRTHLVAA